MSADFENNYFPSIVLIVISLTDIIKKCDYAFVRVRTLPTKLADTREGIRSVNRRRTDNGKHITNTSFEIESRDFTIKMFNNKNVDIQV